MNEWHTIVRLEDIYRHFSEKRCLFGCTQSKQSESKMTEEMYDTCFSEHADARTYFWYVSSKSQNSMEHNQ